MTAGTARLAGDMPSVRARAALVVRNKRPTPGMRLTCCLAMVAARFPMRVRRIALAINILGPLTAAVRIGMLPAPERSPRLLRRALSRVEIAARCLLLRARFLCRRDAIRYSKSLPQTIVLLPNSFHELPFKDFV